MTALTPGPKEAEKRGHLEIGGINRMVACLFDRSEVKLGEGEWGEIVRVIDI